MSYVYVYVKGVQVLVAVPQNRLSWSPQVSSQERIYSATPYAAKPVLLLLLLLLGATSGNSPPCLSSPPRGRLLATQGKATADLGWSIYVVPYEVGQVLCFGCNGF